MSSAGVVVETLRCLYCKVVEEAGSQGLVQVLAFFISISHQHPKKQLDVFSPFVSHWSVFVFLLLPPLSLSPGQRLSAQVSHLVPQQQ